MFAVPGLRCFEVLAKCVWPSDRCSRCLYEASWSLVETSRGRVNSWLTERRKKKNKYSRREKDWTRMCEVHQLLASGSTRIWDTGWAVYLSSLGLCVCVHAHAHTHTHTHTHTRTHAHARARARAHIINHKLVSEISFSSTDCFSGPSLLWAISS